jgi:putative SOS response-associated peptidase YedK
MCGRYTIIARAEEIEKRFNVEVPESYAPRFNAAPTQVLPVITNAQPNGISFFRWGLVPTWAKDKSIGAKMINARSETLTEKASFKQAFKSRRCLVISDGYYEWKRNSAKSKIPFRIHLDSKEIFAYAGLWDAYKNDDDSTLHTFTIITTHSNETTAHIHDRMPVILEAGSEGRWLDQNTNFDELLQLLQPYPNDKIKYHTVSSLVNHVSNDDARLVQPAPAMDQSGNLTLFD